jgi:hypothetical protein
MSAPLATHDYTPGCLDAALEFLKRTRAELRSLRKARLSTDRFQIIDVNKYCFEVRGVGCPDADIAPLLRAVITAFDLQTIDAGKWGGCASPGGGNGRYIRSPGHA